MINVFHMRSQASNESIDEFYGALLVLSKNCSFGELTSSLGFISKLYFPFRGTSAYMTTSGDKGKVTIFHLKKGRSLCRAPLLNFFLANIDKMRYRKGKPYKLTYLHLILAVNKERNFETSC